VIWGNNELYVYWLGLIHTQFYLRIYETVTLIMLTSYTFFGLEDFTRAAFLCLIGFV